MTATEVLVVGEALVDVIHGRGRVDEAPGGSPLNLAVGLSRLGLAPRLVTSLGSDLRGDFLRAYLAANGVDVHNAAGENVATSVATATIGDDGDARYDFSIDWDVDLAGIGGSRFRHVHAGSLGAVLAPGADRVFDLLGRLCDTASISFDPNCRELPGMSIEHARATAERFVAVSDIVKASEDDLRLLYPELTADEAARRWVASGPVLVVVTRGKDGSVAFRRDAAPERMVVTQRRRVADTVGAGDSFMAALLAALADADVLGRRQATALAALPATPRLRWAATAAAITCSRTGADLPTRAEVETELGRLIAGEAAPNPGR